MSKCYIAGAAAAATVPAYWPIVFTTIAAHAPLLALRRADSAGKGTALLAVSIVATAALRRCCRR